MKKRLVVFHLIVSLFCTHAKASTSAQVAFEKCEFDSAPQVLVKGPNKLLQVYAELDRSVFWIEAHSLSDSLHRFRRSIRQTIAIGQNHLLETGLRNPKLSEADLKNTQLTLNLQSEKIRPMNCLEGLLLSVQADRMVAAGSNLYSTPTEFFSCVLKKHDELKIYYYTVDQPGIGSVGILNTYLQGDIRAGWTILMNIHNHNFFPQERYVNGVTSPSSADVQAYRSAHEHYDLSHAVITNGFDSIDLSSDDFYIFHGPK